MAFKILKDDLTKEGEKDHRPWKVIKPKSTIDIRSNNKSNSNPATNGQTTVPLQLKTNQFCMLEDQLTPTPMVINVDNDERVVKTSVTDFKSEKRSSVETKRANSLNNTAGNKERINSKSNVANQKTTVVIGDSLLKNLRQHSIGKATKSKVQVKCFPGARLQDMKHYSIPALSVKPKHLIVHCGTNDLRNKKPDEIVKETNNYANCCQRRVPNLISPFPR